MQSCSNLNVRFSLDNLVTIPHNPAHNQLFCLWSNIQSTLHQEDQIGTFGSVDSMLVSKSLTDINNDDVLEVDPPCFQQLHSVPLWLSKSRTVSNAKNSSPQTHWLVNKQHMPERLVYGPQHQQQERYASWTRSSSPIFPRNTWRCWTNKHSAFAGLVSIVSPKHR